MEEIKADTKEELSQKMGEFYADQIDRLVGIALQQCPHRRRWYYQTDNVTVKNMLLRSCGIQVRQYVDEPGRVAVYRRGKFVDGVQINFKTNME